MMFSVCLDELEVCSQMALSSNSPIFRHIGSMCRIVLLFFLIDFTLSNSVLSDFKYPLHLSQRAE
jgi:hypothetical protein